MRPLRANVSYRMRRRRPSIFSARWFRLLLGGGFAIIVGLVLGPLVAGWLLVPRAGAPVAREPGPASETAAPVRRAIAVPEGERAPPEPTPRNGGTTTGPGAARPAPPATTALAPVGSPVAFRLQVGAFLDHRNADRLVERLRSQGFEVADRVVEQGRVLHRVLASPGEGEPHDVLLERLRTLGFTPELIGDAVAVTAPVPLHEAVDASRRLRAAGITVRLEKAIGAATFRVVRVGRYGTAEEAERARADLAARGIEGFVVREP